MVLLEEFAQAGCRVEFLDQPLGQDPQDHLLVQIRGAVAEDERTLIADFRGAKSAHILHRNLQCFSRILLLFVSGFSFLTSWIVTPLFRYSHRIVEAQKALCA
jgi:hypothetical protein